jgi:hypothetical protein
MKITRDSILFYLVIAIVVLVIIGGLILTLADPVSSLVIILEGSGLLFLWFGTTESRKDRKKILLIGGFLVFSLSSFAYSYSSFQRNQPITASVFALWGIFIVLLTVNFKFKYKGKK